ncbi:DLH domain-containing protein [Mycena venus]|uniref:DLH domain-containing protein n=1 Tax=Mycena venus TaxID=2733690 RepID=A0A8H6YUW4_9AGAR|nr:DLH domain-containing protein [Mycena venus]
MSCPDCFTGSVLVGEPTGVISNIDGAYFANGGNSESESKRAIILLTDIFGVIEPLLTKNSALTSRCYEGLKLKNPKVLADQFALNLKCDVWVPDLFAGHPPVTVEQMEMLPDRAGVKLGFFGILKMIFVVLPSFWGLFVANRKSVVDGRTISFLEKLQERNKYDKLGAIGYCFGGGIATRLGATTSYFDSIVLAHPSAPTDDLIKAIKAPTAWAQPEDDWGIKPARLEEIEALYAGRQGKDTFVDYEIKVYKGCGTILFSF